MKMEKATEGTLTLHLHGELNRDRANTVWKDVKGALASAETDRLVIDFHETTDLDSAGLAVLFGLEKLCSESNITVSLQNVPEAMDEFIRYTKEHSSGKRGQVPSLPDPISRIGEWGLERLRGSHAFIQYIGNVAFAGLWFFFRPRTSEIRETVYQLQAVGAGAVPLMIALSTLMGIIIVFQGLSTLGDFTPDIYIAYMLVIAVTRQMAPLLTGVILAGRSGAAFAAEIGTMKINEEIDALAVMGFDISRFLVLPRVFALMVAGPLLTLLADAIGLGVGLMTTHLVVHVSIESFVDAFRRTLTAGDIYTGLIRGFVFSTVIGLIGCYRGLRTGMGPASIGIQATSAVVTGILFVIVADTFLSVIFHAFKM